MSEKSDAETEGTKSDQVVELVLVSKKAEVHAGCLSGLRVTGPTLKLKLRVFINESRATSDESPGCFVACLNSIVIR